MKKGQPMSEEGKENLRKLRLGKKLAPSHREKVIKTLLRAKGTENPMWRGGKSITGNGYVLVRMPEHPSARSNGYYPEHRLVMEKKLGRLLDRSEHVHHINGIKTDNRPENLAVLSIHEHSHEHWDNPTMRKEQRERMKKIRAKKFWSTKKKSKS